MNEQYPDRESYRALYTRYHNRGAANLLRLLEPLAGMRVADLCGGDGRLTFKLLEEGARSVLFVDNEASMVPPTLQQHERVHVVIEDVYSALSIVIEQGECFDRIVCQQAVNYWLDKDTAQLVFMALKHGGAFVFNTFNQKPPEKPRVLQYELDRKMFVEVSWLVGSKVHHIQIRDGMEPHYTSFQWLPPEQLHEILEPYFTVSEERHGNTSLYRCVRK